MNGTTNPTAALGNALIDALGLPQNVTRLVVTLESGKPPLVECEHVAIRPDVERLQVVKGKYRLEPVE